MRMPEGMAYEVDEPIGVAIEHRVCDAMNRIACGSQCHGAFAIALEGDAIGVIAIAVGFDHDPLGRPKEVDQVALDHDVDMGLRKPSVPTGSEEIDLKRRSGLHRIRAD